MPKMSEKSNSPTQEKSQAEPGFATQKVLESRELLGGRPEVLIRHEGRFYRLRRTRLGKLILTA
jgi:hemin uptake protein HemP